jgi:tRNA pseudouridine(38-40) synthase
LRAIVAYDGTDFCGFQIQRSRGGQRPASGTPRTVQGALEDALAQILQKPTSCFAAGRTDSGVHAVGQVVAFGAEWHRPLTDLHRALNAVLPGDVAVRCLSTASPGFHPRYDAHSRTYCYTIWNHPLRSPLFRRTALWVRQPLDLAAMDEAAQLIVGSHDFGTFGTAPRATRYSRRTVVGSCRNGDDCARVRAPSVRGPTTVRHVVRASWSKVDERHLAAWQQTLDHGCHLADDRSVVARADGPRSAGHTLHEARWQGLIEFTIEANAFLYHMVRSIVGTLLQVGDGNLSISEFEAALNGADRALAGPTAAPQGLCLIRVQYAADAEHCGDA